MWCSVTEKKYTIPCCTAEAMRRIRQVNVDGITVGLSMLDAIFAEVASLDLSTDEKIKNELLRQVKIYNYVPRQAEEAYGEAVLKEYRKGV
jgi:hypothetical protein